MIFKSNSPCKDKPSGERMWVEIVKVNRDDFGGVLVNSPWVIDDLNIGDGINFKHKHIIEVYNKEVK